MPTFALIMLAESLLGFVIAAALFLSAYKKIEGNNSSKARLIIFVGIVFANVIYAIIAALNIYMRSFAVDVAMTMKIPCYVLGLMTLICCVIQGFIIKNEIEKGSFGEESLKMLTGKLAVPEILSIAGLLYFFIKNQIPL